MNQHKHIFRLASMDYWQQNPFAVKVLILVFYLVGVIGFVIPQSNPLFIQLIKWALLFNVLLLVLFHQSAVTAKTLILFLFILMSSFFVEVAGVRTGLIFGHYHYGTGLGIKVLETPLLIGVNWLMLTYVFVAATDRLQISRLMKTIIGAAGMLLYDIILEQLAAPLQMWYWAGQSIPLKNYLAWFVLALIFQGVLHLFKVKIRNPLIISTLIAQFFFFIALFVHQLIAP
jgi:uncharacterized membrane protein